MVSIIHCRTGIVCGIFDLQGCLNGEDSRISNGRGGADDGAAFREVEVMDFGAGILENMGRMKVCKTHVTKNSGDRT